MQWPAAESQMLERLQELGAKNQIWRSYIGMGYYGTLTPKVIQRCILENPGWSDPPSLPTREATANSAQPNRAPEPLLH
jgi:hypothetical protein